MKGVEAVGFSYLPHLMDTYVSMKIAIYTIAGKFLKHKAIVSVQAWKVAGKYRNAEHSSQPLYMSLPSSAYSYS